MPRFVCSMFLSQNVSSSFPKFLVILFGRVSGAFKSVLGGGHIDLLARFNTLSSW